MSIDESVAGEPTIPPEDPIVDWGGPERPLSVSTTSLDVGVQVSARGEVDISTAPLLRIELADAMRDATSVVIDLTDVTFMDSHGLRVLVEAMVASNERPFVVSAASPNVRRLIHVSGLDDSLGLDTRNG
jgi:anti-sigma B factor antagonist